MSQPLCGLRILLLSALLWPSLAAAAGNAIHVYQPRHRTAAELVPLVSGVLAPEGEAIADPSSGRLVLRGDPASIRRALEVLGALDAPLRSYRITSTLTTLEDLAEVGVEVGGWVGGGPVRIGRLAGPEGVAVRIRGLRSRQKSGFEGLVNVIEGRTADLWTGTVEPEHTREVEREGGRIRIREQTAFVPVLTGLRVVPRSLPDGRIELEIEPVQATRDREGRVSRTGAATRVAVAPGEPVALGTVDQQEGASLQEGPFRIERRSRSRESVLLVRVDPVAPAAAPEPGPVSPRAGSAR